MTTMPESEFLGILRSIAPGTALRTAIDNISRSGRGAIIVISNPEEISSVIKGGFEVDCKFTHQKLFELCKMDGAVLIDRDMNKIIAANVLLVPDPNIPTEETGTRHQAAERTAKQAKQLVLAISEKKKTITLFHGDKRYVLRETQELLSRAGEESRMLEKHRDIFNELILKLNLLEFSNMVSLSDVISVVQRAEIISRISSIIKNYIVELGEEGTLVRMQLRELIKNVEDEELLILKDYSKKDMYATKVDLSDLSIHKLTEQKNIMEFMGYDKDERLMPHGHRILSKTILRDEEVVDIIKRFENLQSIIEGPSKLYESEIVNKSKAAALQTELLKIRDDVMLGKKI